jgi:hypothetical protein
VIHFHMVVVDIVVDPQGEGHLGVVGDAPNVVGIYIWAGGEMSQLP